MGNVRPTGRIRPAEWKRPAPKPFLNLNGIRPADKIDLAREYVIRPARHFKNLYEIRKVNVIITKFEQNLFWIVLTKQNWKTLTLKTFLKMAFYFCGEKTPFCYGMLFWFKSVETILYQITPKTFVCWNNLLDDPNYYIHLHKQWTTGWIQKITNSKCSGPQTTKFFWIRPVDWKTLPTPILRGIILSEV